MNLRNIKSLSDNKLFLSIFLKTSFIYSLLSFSASANYESDYISINNTLNDYIEDFEILGNTVDGESVGVKVSGGYKVNIDSNGANLFKPSEYKRQFSKSTVNGDIIESLGDLKGGNHNISFSSAMKTLLKPNTTYTLVMYNLKDSGQTINIEGTLKDVSSALSVGKTDIGKFSTKTFTTNDTNYKDGVSFKVHTGDTTGDNAKYKIAIYEGVPDNLEHIQSEDYNYSFIIPVQLESDSDVHDRMYWDENKNEYMIEKKVGRSNPELIETGITEKIKIKTFKYKTHISSFDTVRPIFKIKTSEEDVKKQEIVDEIYEAISTNLTVENMSRLRAFVNEIEDEEFKIKVQELLNTVEGPTLEFLNATNSVDIYLKTANHIGLSLESNSIIFEDFSGTEDVTLSDAIVFTVNSTLNYDINVELVGDIVSSSGNKADKSLIRVKMSSDNNYQDFLASNKINLLKNQVGTSDIKYFLDMKLSADAIIIADVYKAVLRISIEQI